MKNLFRKRNLLVLLLTFITCLAMVLTGCNNPNDGNGNNTPNLTYYTVTFDSKGGSSVESQRVLKGNPVRRPDLPVYDGYNFTGWYKDEAATANLWNFDTETVNSDLTLYAGWQLKPTENEQAEPTASLIYQKEGNAYIVKDVGEETAIVIPAEHDGLPVVAICGDYGNGAFARKNIVSVIIPDSVTEIGQNTFNNCKELVSVSISANSSLTTIGNNAFSGCSSLKEIYLPVGVMEMGNSVFNNCGALEQITVAQGNTAYRSENGHLIESATNTLIRGGHNSVVPDSVHTIADAAFRRTQGIVTLYILTSVTAIGKYFIADSTVTTVRYQGTQAQWNAIEKSTTMWNYGNRNVVVEYETTTTPTPDPEPTPTPTPDDGQTNVFITYFSATGNTEPLARYASEITGGTLYEIVPAIPYTADDLKYYTDCRADREQNDPTCRPEISGSVADMASYDIVFIGYPIWHGQAPKIIYTFLESYDFEGKTIVPFCTSASSGLGSSASNLHSFAPDSEWKDGRRFAIGTNKSSIESWIDGLNLNIQKEQEMKISVKCNNIEIVYQLNDSTAAKDLYEQLPLTIAVEPYSNNEIIFYPEKLDTSDTPYAKGSGRSCLLCAVGRCGFVLRFV